MHSKPSKIEVPVSKTQVHTVKIVLPVHANHHGTTFGGQVWYIQYYSNTLIVGMLFTRSFEHESQCIVIVIVTEVHNLCHARAYII